MRDRREWSVRSNRAVVGSHGRRSRRRQRHCGQLARSTGPVERADDLGQGSPWRRQQAQGDRQGTRCRRGQHAGSLPQPRAVRGPAQFRHSHGQPGVRGSRPSPGRFAAVLVELREPGGRCRRSRRRGSGPPLARGRRRRPQRRDPCDRRDGRDRGPHVRLGNAD